MKYIHPEKFAAIVNHARKTNPFYARTIPENGPVPVLVREMLRKNNDEILNGHQFNSHSSGAQATTVKIFINAERKGFDAPFVQDMVRRMGGPLPRMDIIYPRDYYVPFFLSIFTPIPEQVDALLQNYSERQSVALITYPSNAVLLAKEIIDRQLDFGFMKRIGMISESINKQQTALIKRAFPNARLWSSYSSTETGMISFQCPYEPDYHHAITDKLGIEILDEQGNECEIGQVGSIVLTDYTNRQMPLIRYEIGDLAAFAVCPCGKIDYPALQSILGKVRGCFLHRDGQRVIFLSLSWALSNIPTVRQFQVIQHEIEHFTIKIVADRSVENLVVAAFTEDFGYTPLIDFEWMSVIPRDPNGKFYESICHV